MAHIRYTRVHVGSKKNQPKVAYFHDSNFQGVMEDVSKHGLHSNKAHKVAIINKQQREDFIKAITSPGNNPNKVTFHKKSTRYASSRLH